MSVSAEKDKSGGSADAAEMRRVVFNLPNQLTWMRLVLSIVMFATIGYEQYWIAMWLFIVAASTDWLDGYFARKYNLVTTLGRILDPFADKFIICGVFIYLAGIPQFNGTLPEGAAYLRPWMAVVVVGRELLVTALRGFLEQRGEDFSASMPGKLKMVFQCVVAAVSLYALSLIKQREAIPAWLDWTLVISIWSAIVMTVYSGVGYIVRAVQLLRR